MLSVIEELAAPDWNWKKPDFAFAFAERRSRLAKLRELIKDDPTILTVLRAHYKKNPPQFVTDWGMTYDPRNADIGMPTVLPFILFPKQVEWMNKVLQCWRERRPLLCEKSRDWGLSFGAMALSCTLCLHYDGIGIGFGSRKQEYVDSSTDPKSLFWKGRFFMEHLPAEFRPGWVRWRDAPHMRMHFPNTGSMMTGEAGDQIGRGDRQSIYFVDEAAYLEKPEAVEHSLSQTTNCRIDMSSVNGPNNPFAVKRHGGKIEVFVCDWKDDPRKDQAWYDDQVSKLDPITVAQEIDRDYQASAAGIVIPGAWVKAALDAHKKLGIAPAGKRSLSVDIADEGPDKNAWCGAEGCEIVYLEQASGKGSDTYATVERTFAIAEDMRVKRFRFDGDGMGALVRGDGRKINEVRRAAGLVVITPESFRGSDEVYDPEGIVIGTVSRDGERGRTNKDFFQNRKAQGWWELRQKFMATWRWVVKNIPCDPADIISINTERIGDSQLVHQLVAELSQPTYTIKDNGKMVIDKAPKGPTGIKKKSPNLGDAVMINRARNEREAHGITQEMIAQVRNQGRRRRAMR
jgi:hypothetical protein